MSFIRKYLLPIHLSMFLSLAAMIAVAQVKLVASANKRSIQENDFVTIQFNIENTRQVDQFVPPMFRGCKVVQGPMHVTGASVINGVQSNYVSFVYVIQPLSTGRFSFSGASAKINGNRQVFNTVKVDVTESLTAGSSFKLPNSLRDDMPEKQLYSDYVLYKGENIQEKIRKNLFIKVDVNKQSCYEGEPIVASYKLYTRLRSESKVSRRPSFNGFSVYDMVDPSVQPSGIEKLNGKDFNVYLIRKAQLFPLQSGALELDAAEVENAVTFLKADAATKENGKNLPELIRAFEADDVLNEGVKTEKVSIRSNPVIVTVKALPEFHRPGSFDGAVGRFSIEANVDKKKVAVKDDVTLKVIIKGEGNFGIINAPSIHWPSNVEAYDATAKEDFLKNLVPLRGYKAFEFSFVPNTAGDVLIPPIEFSYFDPRTQQYHTVLTDSLHVEAMAGAIAKEQMLSELTPATTGTSWWPWMVGAGTLLLLGFGWLGYQHRLQKKLGTFTTAYPGSTGSTAKIPSTAGVSVADIQPAEPVYTPDPLFHARLLMIQSDSQGFYSELGKAVKRTSATFLGLRHDADKNNIEREFITQNVDELLLSQFQLIMQQCEVALYTPTLDEGDMQSAYDFAEDLIGQLKESKA